MIKCTLGEFLKFRGKTKYWLSKETGMCQNTIGELVNNKTKMIKYETLDKICTALNCQIENIITYIKEDTPTK